MFKELEVPFLTPLDEPSITLVRPGYREKYASTKFGSEIYKDLENFEGKPGRSYILAVAVSPHEYWGPNKNHDSFLEEELKRRHHTFVKNGTFYKNHVNKDPLKNYGDNEKSWYDDEMKRVLVLIGVDHKKAPDIVNDIENGKKLSFSMGCVRATAPVLMGDWTYKNMSDISAGDHVINALGSVSEVDYAHSHEHSGMWYHIKALGVKNIEPTTEEHPWLILTREQVTSHDFTPNWVRADNLKVGDYIGTPVIQGEDTCPYDDETVFLLGSYLANGWIGGSPKEAVSLTVHKKDVAYLKSKMPSYEFITHPHPESEEAVHLYVRNSASITKDILDILGRRALDKKIHPSIMRWPIEKQKIFLGAYASGDGGSYQGSMYISTGNKNLATQIQAMMLRCGMIASINIIKHKPSPVVKKHTVEYQIWCGKTYAPILREYCNLEVEEPAWPDKKRFIKNGYLWSPIKEIETELCEETVYNIAVKSDSYDTDSYLISGIALHNCKIPFDTCSICGNNAPTRAEYCSHMRKEAGQIYPDGRRVYVTNPDPTFFDLSKVVRPAGHIEYMIKHVVPKTLSKEAYEIWTPRGSGMEKAAELSADIFDKEQSFADKYARLAKLCTMTKIIRGDAVTGDDVDERLKRVLEKSKDIINLKKVEDLDDDTLGKVAEHPLKSILSTMNLMGINPTESEMTKIIIIKHKSPEVEELNHNLEGEVNPSEVLGAHDPLEVLHKNPRILKILLESGNFDCDHNDVSEKVGELLLPYMEKRSCYPVFLEKRAFTPGGALDIIPAYDGRGNKYLTTSEAVNSATENGMLNTAAKALSTGALTAGTTLLAPKLLPMLGGKAMLPARLFGGLAAGKAFNDAFLEHPGLSTIPAHTVMQKAGSLLDRYDRERFYKEANADMMDTSGLMPMYQGPTVMDRMQPVFNWAQAHPTLATLAGLTLGGLGARGIGKIHKGIKNVLQAGEIPGALSARPVPTV